MTCKVKWNCPIWKSLHCFYCAVQSTWLQVIYNNKHSSILLCLLKWATIVLAIKVNGYPYNGNISANFPSQYGKFKIICYKGSKLFIYLFFIGPPSSKGSKYRHQKWLKNINVCPYTLSIHVCYVC